MSARTALAHPGFPRVRTGLPLSCWPAHCVCPGKQEPRAFGEAHVTRQRCSGAVLIGARGVQGIGAALTAPNALALITTTFPEGKPRNRGVAFVLSVLSTVAVGVTHRALPDALGVLYQAQRRREPRHRAGLE